jgi:hypothetical protein
MDDASKGFSFTDKKKKMKNSEMKLFLGVSITISQRKKENH